ncbi:MAG: hypothetical protein N3A01_00415 [Bacteroidales bacterium]|nr:hypothetical protein [Bacteroidales bacterium]
MEKTNKIVHSLWIGNELTPLEILTIKSFIYHGHDFWLWVYNNNINTPLLPNLFLKDANEIIPFEKVFSYKYSNQYGHGKGSYAGFSDIFRYALLYKYGGWWTDMDVTLLKPLDFISEYVFRKHHVFNAVGNLMKCPPKSILMKLCYEEALILVNQNNKDWNMPIIILNKNIKKLGLHSNIIDITPPDKWNVIKKFMKHNYNLQDTWYAIHWINEEFRRHNINKKVFLPKSLIANLLIKYDVEFNQAKFLQNVKIRYKLSSFYSLYKLASKPKALSKILIGNINKNLKFF